MARHKNVESKAKRGNRMSTTGAQPAMQGGAESKLEFILPQPKPYAQITGSDVPPGIDPDRLAIEYYEYWNSLRD